MILAAGLGTRLMPLTAEIPKALVEVNGIPLLALAIRKLDRAGFREIIVNLHHHGDKIREYLDRNTFPGIDIAISDETGQLLETGGGILKARWFLDGDEPFLVYNVDIVTGIDLKEIYRFHLQSNALATLAVSRRSSSRYFLFDQDDRLCGWRSTNDDRLIWSGDPVGNPQELAFSGIHVISPGIFDHFTESGKFSIVEVYLRLARTLPIIAWDHTGQDWFDLGKPDQVRKVSEYLLQRPEYLS